MHATEGLVDQDAHVVTLVEGALVVGLLRGDVALVRVEVEGPVARLAALDAAEGGGNEPLRRAGECGVGGALPLLDGERADEG